MMGEEGGWLLGWRHVDDVRLRSFRGGSGEVEEEEDGEEED